MRVVCEISLVHFDFWSGAKDNAKQLTYEEMEELEYMLEDIFPDGCTDTQLNDLFWFDFGVVCDWLGLKVNEYDEIIREEE